MPCMMEAQGLTLRLCDTATFPADDESAPDAAAPPETPLREMAALMRLTPGGSESDNTRVS